MSEVFKPALFEEMPIIGIMRNFSSEVIDTIMPLFKKAGFTNLEVTMNSSGVLKTINELSKGHPEINIGAGTVCTMKDLESALDAGASFIVTPIMQEDVMDYCRKNEIPIFPGAYTPLEIYNAWQAGATAVKLFPAVQLGPGYIKDVLAPLNGMKIMPTGGVSYENIDTYFQAGAIGAGMGSTLFDKNLISNGDYDGLYSHFTRLHNKVKECMNKNV